MYQGFLFQAVFQIYMYAIKWLSESERLISLEMTVAILHTYLNFRAADDTTNVADLTLCESLPSIEDEQAFLHYS